MKTLRLAIAGAGQIGRAHAERIRALPGCELVALADPSPAAQALAVEFGVPLRADLAALLEHDQPDGVILATPNAFHVEGALLCLAAGVPALIEKPLADTVADAQRLVAAAQASNTALLVGHHRRHSALLEQAHALIASGALGRLVAVTASATFFKPGEYFASAPWRREPGGGPILLNLVHEIDTLRWLIGEIVEVQALASNAVRSFEVEDTVAINLRFAGGALACLLLSDTAASPHSWELTSGEDKRYDHHGDQLCCVISGTRGSLQLPTLQQFLYAGTASWCEPLQREQHRVPEADPLTRQLAHFCDVLRAEVQPRVGVADAARTLVATLAVAEAARTGRVVTLDATLA